MIDYKDIQSLYFLGIGGIGMSALARYFKAQGFLVMGYDRTVSPLTKELEKEGIEVHYTDLVEHVQRVELTPKHTLVVRTPAVHDDCAIYQYMLHGGFSIQKRAEVLGMVTKQMRALCVAGTHGKTTTSTMLAHIMYQSEIGANAFLGGISNNYNSNVLMQKDTSYVVVEADEYDRSFLQLTPYMAIVTSADPDHLDIYGTEEAYLAAFQEFTSLVKSTLIVKKGLALQPKTKNGVKVYSYSATEEADFYADNIRVADGHIRFDFHTPTETIVDMNLGVPVWVNIENAVAAMAAAWLNGVRVDELRHGIDSFSGVYRRFNIHLNTPEVAYVDDYAHHPEEIRSAIDSIRRLFPARHLIGVFQPHLYSRTRDFAEQFAEVLSTLDEVILLPIYPAREEPIPGVSSCMLLERLTCPERWLVTKDELADFVRQKAQEQKPAVVITLGAGDIDRLVEPIAEALQNEGPLR